MRGADPQAARTRRSDFGRAASAPRLLLTTLLACVVLLPGVGCTTLRKVLGYGDQARQVEAQVRIGGRIETEGAPDGRLVVLLARVGEGPDSGPIVGVDTYVRSTEGSYLFVVGPGRYQVGAYEDRNRDGLLDSTERVSPLRGSPVHDAAAGTSVHLDLMLRNDSPLGDALEAPIDVLALVERTPEEQGKFSLWAFSRHGTVVEDLADERFGPQAGLRGLWRPMDFLNDELAGIYFMEPYDPKRIPVLFVHGISGHPQEFSSLMASLDPERFQAWFYFYPSGVGLDDISTHLATLIKRMQVETEFDELAVVAHSMGGLVARGAILKYADAYGGADIKLFVSIATPWGGSANATRTERRRIALPASLADMSPSSPYLRWLFYDDEAEGAPKKLDRGIEYHMIWGFKGSGPECNDGTVSCESQARVDAQSQARSMRALNDDHVGILQSPETLAHLRRVLDERF